MPASSLQGEVQGRWKNQDAGDSTIIWGSGLCEFYLLAGILMVLLIFFISMRHSPQTIKLHMTIPHLKKTEHMFDDDSIQGPNTTKYNSLYIICYTLLYYTDTFVVSLQMYLYRCVYTVVFIQMIKPFKNLPLPHFFLKSLQVVLSVMGTIGSNASSSF